MSWTELYPQDRDRPRVPERPIVERKPLNVVLPCWKGDQNQARMLLEWIGELGMVQAPFWLACSRECDVEKLMGLARKAFSVVKWINDGEGMISNWNEIGDHPKSAAGPNSLFRQIAWTFALPPKGPWLFLEPDAIICRRDWYDLISREYDVGGRPFMGYQVNPVNHPGVPPHMSGVGVYPQNTPSVAPKAVDPSDVAFDIAGVEQIFPNAHFTNLIYHKYRAPGFTSEEDFNARVNTEVAIWHACKDGSIYPFLRKRLGIVQDLPAPPVPVAQRTELPISNRKVEGSTPSGHVVDIFIKTRPHDYAWLEWCIKSVDKYASLFRETIVLDDTLNSMRFWYGVNNKNVFSKHPGYLWQQVCKLNADQHTDAEYILYMDSDCIFTRAVMPEEFIKDGKPVWQYTPLDQARPDQHVWAPVMEKFLGKKPEHEFMRRHPFVVPAWALREFRKFTQYRHGKSIEDYIMGQAVPGSPTALVFSEWNCLGFFLWEYHRDRVEWVLDAEAGPACVYQGFTHGGEARKQEDLAKFREILGTPSGDGVNATQGEPAGAMPVVHETHPLTIPVAIEFLASSVKNNFHKARIIRDLKRAWKGRGDVPKRSKALSAPRNDKDTLLLCIHSYPGANETVERHWDGFVKSGATRIVGIGTTDHLCRFPGESVEIGKNAYLKMKGKDPHLCQRLLDTVEWCLSQPEDRFLIAEYDVLFLRKMPKFHGVAAFLTGGKVNGSKTNQFYHGPWAFDRRGGEILVKAMLMALPESQEYPDNSPDLFFGLSCQMAKIEVRCPWKMFTRNSLDRNGDLDLAVQAALDGVHCIHGVKQEWEFNSIMAAMNEKEVSLSHVA